MLKQDEQLLEIIPLILRCNSTNKKVEGFHIETNVAKEILESMKDNSFSHLVEVTESNLWLLWLSCLYQDSVPCIKQLMMDVLPALDHAKYYL